jgi:hypothetical protein
MALRCSKTSGFLALLTYVIFPFLRCPKTRLVAHGRVLRKDVTRVTERWKFLTERRLTLKCMEPIPKMKPMAPMKAPERWWPEELGEHPNSAGGQNETRYAFFGDQKRLAVDTGDGKVQLYDTGDHRISGVQQHQSGSGKKVTFTSQHGEVDLAALKPA